MWGTKRLTGDVKNRKALVNAGAEKGKDVSLRSVTTIVRKRRVEDRRMAIPRPTHHPEARCVNVVATQDQDGEVPILDLQRMWGKVSRRGNM